MKMKMKIAISLLNDHGSLARLEDGEGRSVELIESNSSRDAKRLCQRAAKELRACALRFELLAEEPDPFKVTTQDRVNRAKVEAHNDCGEGRRTQGSESKNQPL